MKNLSSLELRRGWRQRSAVTADSEGDPDLYAWQLVFYGFVNDLREMSGLVADSKQWGARMRARGYGDPRSLAVTPPSKTQQRQAAWAAQACRAKCWGKTWDRPLGEAAKQADDKKSGRLWKGRQRVHTTRKNGVIVVQTNWKMGFRGDAVHKPCTARRNVKAQGHDAKGRFAAKPKVSTQQHVKRLQTHIKKNDWALAAANKALAAATRAVKSAQTGKHSMPRVV